MKLSLKFCVGIGIVFFLFSCQQSDENTRQKKINADTNLGQESTENKDVQRYGMVIKLKPDKVEDYKEMHANAWPGVLEQITESNIRNYSIYLQQIEGTYYLFSYYEYTGDNYQKDMKKMAADSVTQAWWELTDAYQTPLESRKDGEWWTEMQEVFHHD